MNILITGANGYIGSVLTQKLFNAKARYEMLAYLGKEVSIQKEPDHLINFDKLIAFDNLMYRQVTLTDCCYRDDFEFVHGDVRNKELLLKYIKEADVIIPLAAIVGFPACETDKELAKAVNYDQIKFIVENTNINQKIIIPNTNSGYGRGTEGIYCTEESPLRPVSVYGETKVEAEKCVMDSGHGISLRLATVFGISPRQRLDLLVNDFVINKALRDGYIVLFEKDVKRNYIHIQDVGITFLRMINKFDEYKNNIYNVGLSSANLSKYELAKTIQKFIPNFVIREAEFSKDPDERNYIVSNEKLEKTGWKAYYSLEDGIKELIKAHKIINHANRNFTNL